MKLENSIEREITSEEIYRAMGISVEAIEKIEEAFLKVYEVFKKIVKEFFEMLKRVCTKIIEQIDIDKLIKYKKYQKELEIEISFILRENKSMERERKNEKRRSKRHNNWI